MATTWTDDPIVTTPVADATRVRKIHVDELRTAINTDLVKRKGSAKTWSEEIVADETKIRATHLNELRQALVDLRALMVPCATNTVGPVSFTAPDPMTDTTTTPDPASKIRGVHIEELRYIINSIEGQCYCDCVGHCSCVSHSHCSCAGMAHCCCQGHGCSSKRYKTNIKIWN